MMRRNIRGLYCNARPVSLLAVGRCGTVRHWACMVKLVLYAVAGSGSVWYGMVMVWCCMAVGQYGMVWCWQWFSMVWHGKGMVLPGSGSIWYGMVMVWYGVVR